MRSLATAVLLLLPLSVGAALAQQLPGSNRPETVPDNYAITPFGYFHPSCVRAVESGATVLPDGRIEHADGTVDPEAPFCQYPHYTARGELFGEDLAPTVAGWLEDGTATTATSFAKLSATWPVPPVPNTTSDNQTDYFFPGLTQAPQAGNILQPVLAWNQLSYAGDGGAPNVWSIASWNCCASGITVHTLPYITVNPGDTILGTVVSTCVPGTMSCPTWNITTKDQSSGATTTLANTSSVGQIYDLAFSGVLEVYRVNLCSDFPPTGTSTFSSVALYDYNFNLISNPGWSFENRVKANWTPQCNYGGQTTATQTKLVYGVITTVSPSTLGFGHHYTTDPPVYATVTLTNNGSAAFGIASIGQNLPPWYLVSGTTCGATLGAGASCNITAEFFPGSAPAGTDRATLVIVDTPVNTQQNVPLIATVSCQYNRNGPVGGP